MGVAAGQLLVAIVGTVGIVVSLVFVAISNSRLAKAQKLLNLQQILAEMNKLRQYRAEHPDLERSMFDNRSSWDDLRVQQNIMAVELANIFEWAYLAKRDGLLTEEVWSSWVETWKSVILASEPLRSDFVDTVWTFGRDPSVMSKLKAELGIEPS